VAACGLTAVSNLLVRWQSPIQWVGGIFLIYLGLATLRSKSGERSAATVSPELWKSYSTTVALTLANPATILSFIAIFAGLGLGTAPSPTLAGATVVGVFLGSAAWWLFLSSLASAVSRRINDRALVWINRASGVTLLSFGTYALVHLAIRTL
jgi:threonine/homoserine/homoserine lactone efflux protein